VTIARTAIGAAWTVPWEYFSISSFCRAGLLFYRAYCAIAVNGEQ